MSNTSSYAIARVGKRFKTNSQIAACGKHNSRSQTTPNADANRSISNECFIGDSDKSLVQLVRDRIGDNGGKKIRTSVDPKQSAVLAFELMLSASPEYFRQFAPGDAGVWELDKLQAWEHLSAQWLKSRYGGNVVRATYHRDESTPHIHAVIVPLNEKGHLNARDYVGNRDKLAALQDSYAEAMQPLGLSRGIRGSKVQHEKIKDYYKSVSQAATLDLSIDELKALAADRQRQVQKRNEFEQTALVLSDENFQLKGELTRLENQVKELQKIVDRRDGLRQILLPEVALKLGMQQSELDASRWYSLNCSIRIDESHCYFSGERDDKYSAIDLVMRVESCSSFDALVWLERQLGSGTAQAAMFQQLNAVAAEIEMTRLVLPPQSVTHWPVMRKRLLKRMLLPSRLVDKLHEQGLIYADVDRNTIFAERDMKGDISGAIKADEFGQFVRINGSHEGAAFYVVMPEDESIRGIERVVITDSPIEALSKLTLERSSVISQQTLYQCMGGQAQLLALSKTGAHIEIATSRSERGDFVEQAVQAALPNVVSNRPEESHQELLKAKFDQLRAAMKPSSKMEKSKTAQKQSRQKKHQKKDRGLDM